ncbi:MAG: hypothetical protein ABSG50_10650 [Opitutaceae bacterium]
MNVRITKMRSLSALKMVAGSLTCFYFALSLFFGVLAIAGCHTVRWNGEVITGIWALPYAVLIALMMSIGSTIFGWLAFTVGLPIFRWIYPTNFECELSEDRPNQAAQSTTPAVTPPAGQEARQP